MSSELLPPNATAQERALADTVGRIGDVPAPLRDLWNPATCPVSLLPWLAWALSVDHWDAAWPEAVKRAAIAEAGLLHRRKGTPWAVERGVVVAGSPNARVEEWFDYAGGAGAPYHFRIVVDIEGADVDAATEARILAAVKAFKNCRSWLDALEYNLSVSGPVPIYALGLQSTEVITVYPL